MLLQPRKFTWKTYQKKRRTRLYKKSTLSYGLQGIKLLQPLRISAKRIFRLKIFLKRATKKSDFTKRSLWINLFPHLPLTKKSKGVRMGKGAGKLSSWYINFSSGTHIIEFRNLRLGRSIYFFRQINFKLPVPLHLTLFKSKNIRLLGRLHINFKHSILQ